MQTVVFKMGLERRVKKCCLQGDWGWGQSPVSDPRRSRSSCTVPPRGVGVGRAGARKTVWKPPTRSSCAKSTSLDFFLQTAGSQDIFFGRQTPRVASVHRAEGGQRCQEIDLGGVCDPRRALVRTAGQLTPESDGTGVSREVWLGWETRVRDWPGRLGGW